jgi:CHAT domain-containing protein
MGAAGNLLTEIQMREQIATGYIPDWQTGSLSNLVRLYAAIGDLESARGTFKRNEIVYAGLSTRPSWSYNRHDFTTLLEQARTVLLRAEGKLAAAEQAARKALDEAQQDTETIESRVKARQTGISPETAYARRDGTELLLADIVRQQGRLGEAELIVRGVLQRVLKRVGRSSTLAGGTAYTLALSVFDQGRYAEAAALTRIVIQTNEALGVSPALPLTRNARLLQASALASQGKWQEAAAEHEKIKAAFAADPQATSRIQSANSYIVVALLKTGQTDEAVAHSRKLLDQSELQLGKDHYATAEARGIHAMTLAAKGEREQALQQFAIAARILIDTSASQATDEGLAPAKTQRLEWILGDYVRLLAEPEGSAAARRTGLDPVAESFQLADALRGQSVQRALASATSRAATNDPALAALVRKEQDLRNEVTVLYRLLSNMLSAPPEQQLPKVTADMRKRIDTIGRERKSLFADIEQRFPAYAGLINPKPASIERAKSALRPGEALLSLLSTPERTYVWALTKDGPSVFASSALGETEIARIVAKLRGALDPGNLPLDRYPSFDLNAAYRLYAELLKPVESGWNGAKTLLVSANGAIAQIPLALLPTEPQGTRRDKALLFDRYREVEWLAKRVAIAQLPAVNSLVTLRALPAGNAKREMFAGFGDPTFARTAIPVAPEGGGFKRNAGIPRADAAAGNAKPLDWMRYEDIPPLPDTRDEILSIARALGADLQKDVFLGSEASKQKLQSLDLSNRRIIAFATHGLIPGDFPNLTQPALALATPTSLNETGLLTLEDILGLKLDADWVVLSACNTAAGDGQGAESISGLGRGFFYAGSRALLVTHWPVESISAKKLVTGIFERYTQDAQLTRAEALRQSILALMQGEDIDPATGKKMYSYAHPMFWAPYALVGDGAR